MQGSSDRALASCPPTGSAAPERADDRRPRPYLAAVRQRRRKRFDDYTFVTQILETYDFTRAVQVAVREYAPDRIILLGPGDTLGGAIAQALIAIEWRGLSSKEDFQEMQAAEPFLLAMGREDQRALATG